MARKIRFPLHMNDGADVRTIEELQEHFDLESVLGYFTDGKLKTWLEDRYYDEQAAAVGELSSDMPDLGARLSAIFGIEAKDTDVDIEEIQRRKEKLRILSAYTADKEILDNVDLVAMDQDDLFDILDTSPTTVYLFSEEFSIPIAKKNITYIGLNGAQVKLSNGKELGDYKSMGIKFISLFDEENISEAEITFETDDPEILSIKTAKLYDVVRFGKYDWYVIDITPVGCQLLCKDVIDEEDINDSDRYSVKGAPFFMNAHDGLGRAVFDRCDTEEMLFNGVIHKTTWYDCSLREYLNSVFFNSFSDNEKRHIKLTTNKNDYVLIKSPDYMHGKKAVLKKSDYSDTEDHIFLLSVTEAENLPIKVRKASILWWLRTISKVYNPKNTNVAAVTSDGHDIWDRQAHEAKGVRPSLCLQFSGSTSPYIGKARSETKTELKICSQCGARILNNNMKFCAECGNRLV